WYGDLGIPAASFASCDSGYSGFPLTFVTARPIGSPLTWLYVGDSSKMRKFSASFVVVGVPQAVQIGLPLSVGGAGWFKPTGGSRSTGPLTGTYYYRYQLEDINTGALSQPGPPTGTPNASFTTGTAILSSQKITFNTP